MVNSIPFLFCYNIYMEKIVEKILEIDKEVVLVSIDGRCASGKTTLARKISKIIDCNVFHMDDFFLQKHQRERQTIPGENVDYERFLEEVLIPLTLKKDVYYRLFDCKDMKIKEGSLIKFKKNNIIEGVYSNNINLTNYYDYKIFLDVNSDTQMKRIIKRNTNHNDFKNKWIPLEEKYFKEFDIKNKCDLVIDTSDSFVF